MTKKPVKHASPLHDRIHEEMLDSFDEELELEIDDDRLDALTNEFSGHTAKETVDRRIYFKELFRLQGELVKLQTWVQHHKLKVVVIFEGRDSAGKGGVIKRITQRLNPRVCRVAALPAPSERERTQWYFQRYVQLSQEGDEFTPRAPTSAKAPRRFLDRRQSAHIPAPWRPHPAAATDRTDAPSPAP